jgi:hypothetical protein
VHRATKLRVLESRGFHPDGSPAIGESFQFGELRFEIVLTLDRRIELVCISRVLDQCVQD